MPDETVKKVNLNLAQYNSEKFSNKNSDQINFLSHRNKSREKYLNNYL